MHLNDLRRFLDERGFAPGGILRAVPARMRGYRLAWNYFSRVRDGAAANVVADPAAELLGVALRVDTPTLRAIDIKEGHPSRYNRGASPLPAQLMRGDGDKPIDAWLYVVRPKYLSERYVAPRRHYLALMIEGARQHGLDPDYVAALRNLPTAD